MKLTPELHTKGFYEFKLPWSPTLGVTYECLAVRSFEDIYKLGIDVYTHYYASVGLVNGQTIGATKFDFEVESKLYPNIVTLKGSDGSMLYIPDTFIDNMPDKSLVPYSEVILAVSLGPVPDVENLDSIKGDVTALIAARMNIDATVNICKASIQSNPTVEEHRLLQALRKGTPPAVLPNTHMLLEDALNQIKERDLKIKRLLDIIRDKGLTTEI